MEFSRVDHRVLAEASSFLMSHKTNIASLDLFLQNELKWTILHFAILSYNDFFDLQEKR